MRITGFPDLRLAAMQRLALAALPRATVATAEPVPPAPIVAPPVQSQTSVAMLVAIGASDPALRRRHDSAAAANGLRALERLHDELRCGKPSATPLDAIAAWMGDHATPDEPFAAELLREVELRVLVELAKAERDA